jgi:hypothetical protein
LECAASAAAVVVAVKFMGCVLLKLWTFDAIFVNQDNNDPRILKSE